MTRWEYLFVVHRYGELEFFEAGKPPKPFRQGRAELFAYLGQQGWELTSQETSAGGMSYYEDPPLIGGGDLQSSRGYLPTAGPTEYIFKRPAV